MCNKNEWSFIKSEGNLKETEQIWRRGSISTLETTLIRDHPARFLSTGPLGDILLISDSGKGVCTSGMLQAISDRARDAGVPILVDPTRGWSWSNYGQFTLIKANRVEAMSVAARETRPLAMARRLADEHRCNVVMTRGGHGMVAAERKGGIWYLPAEAADVRDVCGTGDTVISTLGTGIV